MLNPSIFPETVSASYMEMSGKKAAHPELILLINEEVKKTVREGVEEGMTAAVEE